MKLAGLSILLGLCFCFSARADLTIVQKVEGSGPSSEMTIKIKGDKARIDATPQMSMIIDGKTGEMINLMHDQKTVIRMSAQKMKAAAEVVDKFADKEKAPEKAKLTPTGRKEKVNGFDVEEYLYETPSVKAMYWIAPKYPDGAAVLKEMQALKSEFWKSSNVKMPEYSDFAGVPIKAIVSLGGTETTSTIMSIRKDPLSEGDFSVPKDYQEIKTPAIGTPPEENRPQSAASASPGP